MGMDSVRMTSRRFTCSQFSTLKLLRFSSMASDNRSVCYIVLQLGLFGVCKCYNNSRKSVFQSGEFICTSIIRVACSTPPLRLTSVRKSSPDVPFAPLRTVRGEGGERGFSRLSGGGRDDQNDCCMIAMSFRLRQ